MAEEATVWMNSGALHAVRPHRWFVRQMGTGPDLVLLHGAGGSSHSWTALTGWLSQHYRLTAIDLPGQGRSQSGGRARLSLPNMAVDTTALIETLGIEPVAIVGHSAGAALALRIAARHLTDVQLVAINGAFENFGGAAGWLFPMMAKMLALNPLAGVLLSQAGSNEARVRKLIEGTGSVLPSEALAEYQRLMASRAHVEGTIGMMAAWSLTGIDDDARAMDRPALLLTGGTDSAVPPQVSARMAGLMPAARHEVMDGLGHLAHEEGPARVAEHILTFLRT